MYIAFSDKVLNWQTDYIHKTQTSTLSSESGKCLMEENKSILPILITSWQMSNSQEIFTPELKYGNQIIKTESIEKADFCIDNICTKVLSPVISRIDEHVTFSQLNGVTTLKGRQSCAIQSHFSYLSVDWLAELHPMINFDFIWC